MACGLLTARVVLKTNTPIFTKFYFKPKIDMMKSIKASYSKRIFRPGMRYINPNTSFTDVFAQQKGITVKT